MSVLDKPCWVRKGGVLAYWSRCYRGDKVGEVVQLLDADEETYRATMELEFNRFAGAGPAVVDFDEEKDAQDYVERGLRLHLQAAKHPGRFPEPVHKAADLADAALAAEGKVDGGRTRQWEHHGGDDVLVTMDGAVEGGRAERRGAVWYGIVYDPAGEAVEAPFGTQDEAQRHVTRVLAKRDWPAWRAERQRINEASAARKAAVTVPVTPYTPPAYATAPAVKAPAGPGDELPYAVVADVTNAVDEAEHQAEVARLALRAVVVHKGRALEELSRRAEDASKRSEVLAEESRRLHDARALVGDAITRHRLREEA